ncbi:hypothetical protein EL836_23005 [Salmonella enterica subsp. enterica serovar Poona]|nr:hypothetical protein [Salmonella enterica subsp. enterica serovar Poona]
MEDTDGVSLCTPSVSSIVAPHEKMDADGSILWEQRMGAGVRSYLLLPYTAPINKKSLQENNSRRLFNDVILFIQEHCNLD